MPITLTGGDPETDTLTYSIVTPPAIGTLSGTAPNVRYTPAANYVGMDRFTFKVSDTAANVSPNVTVNITVNAGLLFTNGSFETQGTGLGGPWALLGVPWSQSVTGFPSQYQQLKVVDGAAFSSTLDGGLWAALISTDDVPITNPLVQQVAQNVTAGDTLSVTFWLGRQIGSPGGQGVAYFDVGGTRYPMTFDTSLLAADSWQSYTLTKIITNSGSMSLGFYATTKDNSWLDNISNVTVTPSAVDPNTPSTSYVTLTTVEDTPMARSLPLWMCVSTKFTDTIMALTWPPIKSVMAWEPPL